CPRHVTTASTVTNTGANGAAFQAFRYASSARSSAAKALYRGELLNSLSHVRVEFGTTLSSRGGQAKATVSCRKYVSRSSVACTSPCNGTRTKPQASNPLR